MLNGIYTYNVDGKGRIVMPGRFLDALGNPFVLTGTQTGCLVAASQPRPAPGSRPGCAASWSAASRTGRAASSSPAPCASYADLHQTGEAAVIGAGDEVEIWNKRRWEGQARSPFPPPGRPGPAPDPLGYAASPSPIASGAVVRQKALYGQPYLEVEGALTLPETDRVLARLETALRGRPRTLFLDLRGVETIDASFLVAMEPLVRQLAAHGEPHGRADRACGRGDSGGATVRPEVRPRLHQPGVLPLVACGRGPRLRPSHPLLLLLLALSVLVPRPARSQSAADVTFAYAAASYSIAQFRVGPQGTLTPLHPANAPLTQDITQEHFFAAAGPTGQFVYSLDYLPGNIVRYATRADGTINLASAKKAHIKGHPDFIAFDPTGRRAYVVDDDILTRGEQDYSRVYQFTVGNDDTLTPMTPAFAETGGTRPERMFFVRGGRFAYIGHSSGIFQYRVRPNGTLAPLSPADVRVGTNPENFAVDPMGRFAFVTDYQDQDHIYRFAIGAGGTLKRLPPLTLQFASDFEGGQIQIAVDPTGQFVYVMPGTPEDELPQGTPFSIYQFQLLDNGDLVPLSPARVATAGGGGAMAFDPTGAFAYVTGDGSRIAQYRVSPGGGLIALTPRVAPDPGDSSRVISIARRGASPPPSVAAIVEARQRWASLPDGSPDMSEKLSPGDPSRADFFTWQTRPAVVPRRRQGRLPRYRRQRSSALSGRRGWIAATASARRRRGFPRPWRDRSRPVRPLCLRHGRCR